MKPEAPKPASEQQPPSPDQKKNVEQVITEMVAREDQKPETSKKEGRQLEKMLKIF